MRGRGYFVSLRYEAHGLLCELSRVLREVHKFYVPRPLAARLFIAPVRSDSPPAPPTSLIAARASLIATSATFLQRLLPSLQPVLASLYRLQRHNMRCNKASPPCNNATTHTASHRCPTKVLSTTTTLHFARLLHRSHPFPPYFPYNPPATPPRATQQVAHAPFRPTATQSALKSQAPLRGER